MVEISLAYAGGGGLPKAENIRKFDKILYFKIRKFVIAFKDMIASE